MTAAVDWGDGAYEVFSPSLGPAAARLVEAAAPQPGERAVDLGCGDGNATILLAQTGAQVTAVDPSGRLLRLAEQRARDGGHPVGGVQAPAEALPLPDDSADLVVSNFGVIFSPDPAAAVREILRVLTPDGRFLYTAWLPEGAIAELGQHFRAALPAPPSGEPGQPAPGDRPFAWHESQTVAELAARVAPGVVRLQRAELDFHAPSARAFNDEQAEHHPMWRAFRGALDDEARWAALMDESVELLAAAAPPGDRFIVRSGYVIGELRSDTRAVA